MFDLEKEIKLWKKALHKHRGFEDGYCEELSSHLLDNISELKKKGFSEKDAFEKSVEQLGFADEISQEFYKTDNRKKLNMEGSKLSPFLLSGYVKLGFRNILKHKGYSFINIAGLALGLALFIIAALITVHELSYDQFHTKKKRIYRVYNENKRNGQMFRMAPVEIPFAPAVKEDCPEVEKTVRLTLSNGIVQKDDLRFSEGMTFADKDFFDVFSFKLLRGDKRDVLKNPFSVALSEKYSKKYFGDENPVGKELLIDQKLHTVTGVFEDLPSNSHIREDMFVSYSTYLSENKDRVTKWNQTGNDYTYLLIAKETNVSELEAKIAKMIEKYYTKKQAARNKFLLQPLEEVHFSNLNYDFAKTTPKSLIYIFNSVCIFILLIGCINFINLSTAKATERAREVGLRKVSGAGRGQLIRQFLIECVVISFFALLLALVAVKLALPEISAATNKMIEFSTIFSIEGILFLIILVLATGLLAGFYPAIVLSKYDPAIVMRSSMNQSFKGVKLRSILVVSQFVISVILIIANFTILEQIDYMKTKPLGFNIKNLVTVRAFDSELRKNIGAFKNDLLNSKYFEKVSASTGTPFSGSSSTSNFRSSTSAPDQDVYMQVIKVDEDFTETFKIILEDGRFFNKEITTDFEEACLINQAAQNKFGWTNSIGKEIFPGGSDKKYKVVGVIRDFHYTSAREKIKPTVLLLRKTGHYFMTAYLNPNFKEEAMEFMKKRYEKFAPYFPFSSFQIEERMNKKYFRDVSIFNILIVCTVIALFVCSLGILGLVSFTVNKKRKEFGIRKILGANVTELFKNISLEFYKWVIISNVIAWPVSYYIMTQWLQNYSYRIEFNFLTFLIAGGLTTIITFAVISYQLITAARENPVKSLRCE